MPDPTPIVYEAFNSRRGTTPYGSTGSGTRNWSREFIARYYADEVAARDAVAAHLAANSLLTLDGCPLRVLSLEEDNGEGDFRFKAVWELSAATSPSTGGEEPIEPPWEYSFDIGISTFRRTKSLDTVEIGHDADVNPPNFGGAIGVTKDGVEGVECADDEGTEEFSVDLDRNLVTPAFRRSIRLLAGKVNSDAFLGHEAGEARFDGARGTIKADGRVRITFRFTWRPNEETEGYEEFFGGVEYLKEGWDYIWEYTEKTIVETSTGPLDDPTILKYPGQRTIAVYVERVYKRRSFALLQAILDGAGTGTYTPPPPPPPPEP